MDAPIRILQMIGSLNMGGSQTMIINLYKNIDRSKIQFDFILDHPLELYYKEMVVAMGAKIYFMPTFKGTNVLEIKKAWNAFFAEHPEYKILHSHVRSYASLYLPIAKKYGVKTIIHSHSTANGKGFASVVKRILQYPLRRQADYLFACSEESGKWLFGKKAIKKSNYRMLPNAVDTAKYAFNEVTRAEMRCDLGVEEGAVVYGHVGRLHPAKNHLFLLEVFKGVLEKQANAVLMIVGDGELRGEIEAKICELGIGASVKLLGARSDVPDLMQAMDVFVFPSKWEGLPVTVVEAQAAGLPCFISNTITKDVDVSMLIKRLPVASSDVWVDEILNSNLKRLDAIPDIINAGFDVKEASAWLDEFYNSLI